MQLAPIKILELIGHPRLTHKTDITQAFGCNLCSWGCFYQSHRARRGENVGIGASMIQVQISDFHITVKAHSVHSTFMPSPLSLSDFIWVQWEVGTARDTAGLLLAREWPVVRLQEDPQPTLLPLLGWDRTLVAPVSELCNHRVSRHLSYVICVEHTIDCKVQFKRRRVPIKHVASQTDFFKGDLDLYVCMCVCSVMLTLLWPHGP